MDKNNLYLLREMPKKKRYIDAVKGFCMFVVLACHAGEVPYIWYFTACFMQTFFILGGITYHEKSGETFRQFFWKKSKRLLVPYFLYSIALLIIDAIWHHLNVSKIARGGWE